MNKNDIAVIMAGGTNMYLKSGLPPVMAKIMGKPMILHVTGAAVNSGVGKVVTVVPAKDTVITESLKAEFPGKPVFTVEQNSPLGTANAVLQAYEYLKDCAESVNICPWTLSALKAVLLKSGVAGENLFFQIGVSRADGADTETCDSDFTVRRDNQRAR